ncbi:MULTISPECIES: hypothetical protein [Weeksella]|uniref:hypothetical protein n=1 Tax=Weeksella TaxID=1013 RepID=UPI0008C3A7A6|nr:MULTISPECIES: hypothetical protein [Weeksella]MDK7374709.1 hypothetical protein [Weeksella virosa]OFM85388.1 hypothetical protein HMPREF2660_07465 [Weeksella sp. HMSC059D05]
MMKKGLLFCSFLALVSCYTYQLIDPTQEVLVEDTSKVTENSASANRQKAIENRNKKALKMNPYRDDNSQGQSIVQMEARKEEPINNQKPKGIAGDIKLYLKPSGTYRLYANQTEYTVVVQKWDGDSLTVYPRGKENQTFKLHKKDIDQNRMYSRNFSKRKSDMLTIAGYAAGLATVILLLK